MDSSNSLDELNLPSINIRDKTISPTQSTQWIGSEDFFDFTSSRENSGNNQAVKPSLPEIRLKGIRSSIDMTQAMHEEDIPLPTGMTTPSIKLSSASLRRSSTGSFLMRRGMFRGSIAEEVHCDSDAERAETQHDEVSESVHQHVSHHPEDDEDHVEDGENKANDDHEDNATPQERFEGRVRARNDRDSHAEFPQRESVKAKTASSSSSSPSPVVIRQGGTSQDYLALARLYKIQRPYSDPSYQALCLLCQRNFCEDVFFPCEHHCVCRKCIRRERICEEHALKKDPNGYCQCSLCASTIKRILPMEHGAEVKKYWDWVYEEKVQLPIGFMRNWRHSGAVIKKIYIDEKYQNSGMEGVSSFCVIA